MVFLQMLIAHFLGEFYLQTTKMVAAKKEKFKVLIGHSIIYSILVTLSLVIFLEWLNLIILFSVVFLTHIFVDKLKIFLSNKYNSDKAKNVQKRVWKNVEK